MCLKIEPNFVRRRETNLLVRREGEIEERKQATMARSCLSNETKAVEKMELDSSAAKEKHGRADAESKNLVRLRLRRVVSN